MIPFNPLREGLAEKAMDAFYVKYDTLSFSEQNDLDNNPADWGRAFNGVFESMKRQQKAISKNAESDESPVEPMDTISDGDDGRSRTPEPKKSYLTMPRKEFMAERKRLTGLG